jgi:hypothetical protein
VSNVIIKAFGDFDVGASVDVPRMRSVDVARLTERDEIEGIKPQIWIPTPILNVVDVKSYARRPTQSAAIAVAPQDFGFKVPHLIAKQFVRGANRRDGVEPARDAVISRAFGLQDLHPVFDKAPAGSNSSARFATANRRSFCHYGGAAITQTSNLFAILGNNDKPSKSHTCKGAGIRCNCALRHSDQMLADCTQATA